MKRAALVLAVLAGVALAAGTALAEHPGDAGVVQMVSHGHHGHYEHHGYYGGKSYGGRHGGFYGHDCYGPPAVVYPVPAYPRVYSYPGSMPHYYSYPGSTFYYRGRNFGFSIGY